MNVVRTLKYVVMIFRFFFLRKSLKFCPRSILTIRGLTFHFILRLEYLLEERQTSLLITKSVKIVKKRNRVFILKADFNFQIYQWNKCVVY